jgi:RNA polymerase sigma factor (sigma-70 family)
VGNEQEGALLRDLCRLAARRAGNLSDRELMQRFVAGRDEAAFEALVRRHGPMVLQVCRRVLRGEHDAEDVFQATFLVLARKAGTLRQQESVGNWLYGVASRLSLRARADAARRRDREGRVAANAGRDPLAELTVREAQEALDEELVRLPARYRAPLILCCLEGLARDEAAQQLGCRAATLKSRLERARTLLRRRLARRGLVLPSAMFASLLAEGLAEAAVPPSLLQSTVRAALAFAAGAGAEAAVSAVAITLAEGALRGLSASRLKLAALILLAVLVCGSGAAWLLIGRSKPEQPAVRPAPRIADAQGREVLAEVAPPDRESPERPEVPPAIVAGDWPQWRGPDRDGVVHGVIAPAKWPRTLTEEWTVPVGEGVASPVVVGGSAYVFTRENDNEVVRRLDLARGREVWRSEPYAASYNRRTEEGKFSIGPRSTPAVAGGRVYTLGMSGVLSCLDAGTGKLVWRRDCKPSQAPPDPAYGGSSPLVADDLCIVHGGDGKTGGLTAFDAATGEVRWCCSEGYVPMSGSPILVDLAGERQLVTYSASNAAGVAVATGRKLWGTGTNTLGPPYTTPLRYRDLLILNDMLQPPRAFRLEKTDQGIAAKEVWKAAKGLTVACCSPVIAGDLVFGMSSRKEGCFFCLDAASGATLWESDGNQGAHASLLNAGGVLLFLTEKGLLLVVKPSAAAFEPIAEYRVSDTETYAHPVLLGDRILIKDQTTLRCFRIEGAEAARMPEQRRRRFLDLQPHATQRLSESFVYDGNNLASLPRGEQTLGGVPFQIGDGLILLRGKGNVPSKVEGIRADTNFSTLHVLHATHWSLDPQPAVVGSYTLNYEDRSQEIIPIVSGKDVNNWWYHDGDKPPSRAVVGWKGANDAVTTLAKSSIRLYVASWPNPHPARRVVSIDFASTRPDVVPFCVAMTVEE